MCHVCGSEDHLANRCPQRPSVITAPVTPKVTTGMQCFTCGGRGHRAAECPSGRRATDAAFLEEGGDDPNEQQEHDATEACCFSLTIADYIGPLTMRPLTRTTMPLKHLILENRSTRVLIPLMSSRALFPVGMSTTVERRVLTAEVQSTLS